MKTETPKTSIGIELDSKTAFFLGVLAGRHNLLQYAKEWAEANPHHVIAEWAKEHPEKISEAWQQDNIKKAVSAWVDGNPERWCICGSSSSPVICCNRWLLPGRQLLLPLLRPPGKPLPIR